MTPQTKTAIALSNGDFFDFRKPHEHEFDIKSIGFALSNLCRYTGHVNPGKFYSVAEHCVLVSRVVPPKYALEGLLHDASEAYCGDVASPLKRLLPGYNRIEESVQEAISTYFGLTYPFPEEVHKADKALYIRERQTIANCGSDALWHTDVPAAEVEVLGLTPKKAYQLFMDRYEELTRNAKGFAVLRKKAA